MFDDVKNNDEHSKGKSLFPKVSARLVATYNKPGLFNSSSRELTSATI